MGYRAIRLVLIICLIACALGASGQVGVDDGRSLIDNSRGGFFMKPFNGIWSDLGADDGMASGYDYDAMSPESVKAIHARLQHFELADNNNYSYFPHTLCKQYEADEIRQGRQPLWVTAYWQGQHRPVLFSWHWTGGWGATQAINIRDDRFIKFYINNYVRAGLMNPHRQNWWVGLDNCAFRDDLYGVLDDQSTPVFHLCKDLGIVWDRPFPQNDNEWTSAAAYCFASIRKLAPDIHFMCNEGTLADESKYRNIFANSDGILLEGFLDGSGTWGNWSRADFHDRIYKHLITVYRDKLQIFQSSHLSMTDDTGLRTGYCAHLILGGANRFFGPSDDSSTEVNPQRYANMKNSLGDPTGLPVDMQTDSSGANWLFSRRCTGGWVYFNDTGANYTVQMPSGTWYDREGRQVTSLTIGRGEADYVKDTPGERCARPMINPRRPMWATTNVPSDRRPNSYQTTGPLTISISTEPWTTGTTIRYTLDGSVPDTNSRIYTGPFTISGTCVVRARAWKAGLAPSFGATAKYNMTIVPPLVEFHLAADEGSEFLDTYPLVKLRHPSGQTVRVNYRVTGGTAASGANYELTSGTLVFPPGECYRNFKMHLVDNSVREGDKTVVISLSSPQNAMLGPNSSFTYVIKDND